MDYVIASEVPGRLRVRLVGPVPADDLDALYRVLGACPPEYPLQKKRHTVEFLRTMPHLRPRTNTFSAAFRVRSVAAYGIHKFLQDRKSVV